MRKVIIPILIALFAMLIFLPQILSTTIGKTLVQKALEKKFQATVSIESLRLHWLGPQTLQRVSLSNQDFQGTIATIESSRPLWSFSQFGHAFSLKDAFFSFPKYGSLSVGPIQAAIKNHDVSATGQASQGGSFTVQGKIYSKTDFDIVAQVQNMPSVAIDSLLQANGLFVASVGATCDLASVVVYNGGEGSLKIDFSSPRASLKANGQIAQDAFLLKEPLFANLLFSSELSRAIDGRVLEARNPITLQIETANASIPLNPFQWNRLEIGQATLNLGQLVCTGLHPLISLFALLKQAPIAQSTAVVWFTPISFSVTAGLLHLGRIDALIGNAVHLCSWGQIDLPTQNLNLVLGLPADTLQQSLGIKSLPRNYVLQIPIRGTIDHPKYETGAAAAKIAALVAGEQISNQLLKKAGPLKGLLNPIGKLTDDTEAPPANRPFPWE